ncbi:CASP-like protein XL3 [Silene latifolia]|uniref:CASP-like protein XL3 n=1 Tax=Silene latifolia TaxID=37657 RepID=UPI003D76C20D
MGNNISLTKIEVLMRLFAFVTLFLAALIVVVDSESKMIFGYYKQTASYKLVTIARMYVYVHFIGAGYSLFQFVRCLALTTDDQGDHLTFSSHMQKWTHFSLDQVMVYLIFATNCAISEIADMVLMGSEVFQWMKLCNKFTKFCVQIGGAILCGLTATLLLAVISGISTFNLFRWYSPNSLCLKPKRTGMVAPVII